MTWFDWSLVVLWVLNAWTAIINVGKPRKPSTPLDVACAVAICTALTVGLLITRGAFA